MRLHLSLFYITFTLTDVKPPHTVAGAHRRAGGAACAHRRTPASEGRSTFRGSNGGLRNAMAPLARTLRIGSFAKINKMHRNHFFGFLVALKQRRKSFSVQNYAFVIWTRIAALFYAALMFLTPALISCKQCTQKHPNGGNVPFLLVRQLIFLHMFLPVATLILGANETPGGVYSAAMLEWVSECVCAILAVIAAYCIYQHTIAVLFPHLVHYHSLRQYL